jgi:integrase
VKPSTLSSWQYILDKWILPELADLSMADVNNAALKRLVEKLSAAKLSPQSIQNICQIPKLVLASAVDNNGEELYPRKWNAEFIDMPVVQNQRQPVFTSEQVSTIVEKADGKWKVLFAILAGTGLRAGEALGLEIGKHISDDCTVISVRQSLWHTEIVPPKTKNGVRDIDVHPDLAAMLKAFIGDRKSGLLFRNRVGKFMLQTNVLRRRLHPILENIGAEKTGLHAFRRFRVTHLRKSRTPENLLRYWIGHSCKSITDDYDKGSEDKSYRKQCVLDAGLGFELHNCPSCPSETKKQEQQIAA